MSDREFLAFGAPGMPPTLDLEHEGWCWDWTAYSVSRSKTEFVQETAFDRLGKHCTDGCFPRSRDFDYYDNHG